MASFFRYWLPPILWAALISLFSTDRFTSEQTSAILLPLLRWLFPQATQATLESLHALTRKLGHWAEFFVLSLLIYRAIRQERIPPGSGAGHFGLSVWCSFMLSRTNFIKCSFRAEPRASETAFWISLEVAVLWLFFMCVIA